LPAAFADDSSALAPSRSIHSHRQKSGEMLKKSLAVGSLGHLKVEPKVRVNIERWRLSREEPT
jgi:hypothetical protein